MSDPIKEMEKHLDKIDVMKADIQKDIEWLFNKLNAKSFIKDSITSPGVIVKKVLIFAITERIIKKYIKPTLKESQRYVKNVLGTKSEKKL